LTAQKLRCPIRCVFFTAPIELAQHNNVYRACIKASRPLLPTLAFASYAKNLEEPSIDEGFDELKKVHFVFEGSAEERASWDKYLL
jgi:bifunctional polynucleotide phosphatase/kinase